MDTYNLVLNVLVTGCGLYIAYTARKVKRTRELEGSILIGKNVPVKRTSDKEGYIDFICPRAFIFGIIITIAGIAQAFLDRIDGFNYLNIFVYCGSCAVLVLFCVMLVRAQKKYIIEPAKKKKKT